ncbi:MAG TPA: hypothetical protein VGX26_02760 [Solirubrobacteraceae bacterium]|nr:hypothetical protein [Solirubrobacteraceae bacterium]
MSSARAPTPARRTPVTPARTRRALAAFVACMRGDGIAFPAPGVKPVPHTPPVDTKTPQFKAAVAKCRPLAIAALKAATTR